MTVNTREEELLVLSPLRSTLSPEFHMNLHKWVNWVYILNILILIWRVGMSEDTKHTVDEAHMMFAKETFGKTWEFMEKSERTQGEDSEMLHTAHTSLYHWLHAGTGLHHQRGEWLISRVHSVLGNPSECLRHAERCNELTQEHADLMQDFDIAFAHESMARAHALIGNKDDAEKYMSLAEEAGNSIADKEDREYFFKDFRSGEWKGLM
jgi:hypothetical protein